MIDYTQIMSMVLYFFITIIIVFLLVHSSLQMQNIQIFFTPERIKTDRKKTGRNIIIIVFCLIAFFLIYNQTLDNMSSAQKSKESQYKELLGRMYDSLLLIISINEENSYDSAEKLANTLMLRYPVKKSYYLNLNKYKTYKFTKSEIKKYRLEDFVNKPTIVRYDGILVSIIKYENECNYVNTRYLGNSDCIIEVDINSFKEPNEIGKDRTIFAIDGRHNTIKADKNFFGY